ncbi:MAG: hypothetical protein A07HN63_02541 [uncultured archaeon A07HN63]|nr:MAG: hypothetical protein A07HN63_02541 [uncultured archaeon A07HN63]
MRLATTTNKRAIIGWFRIKTESGKCTVALHSVWSSSGRQTKRS